MQLFTRRRIIIKTMEEDDVESYYLQFTKFSKEERELKIKQTKEIVKTNIESIQKNTSIDKLIYVVQEVGNKRVIGTILVKIIGSDKLNIELSIPNEQKKISYGSEIIDQFIKICKEERFFEFIKLLKLDLEDEMVQKYMKDRNITSAFIDVA